MGAETSSFRETKKSDFRKTNFLRYKKMRAFSCGEKTQKYFVKVLLGEEKALGKNPVELKGFFEREV